MKAARIRILFGIVLSLMLITIAINARSEWITTGGDEMVILVRNDNTSIAPYHQINAGIYGKYDNNLVFHPVLNFNNTQPLVLPYTWSQVIWIPGPMDADTTSH